MQSRDTIETAGQLMQEFSVQTGLAPAAPGPQRYLWTDAFAVCNFLALHKRTGKKKFMHLARALVGEVHRTLGRHREDDGRSGWLSGLEEEAGKQHPTLGGLRIGKKLNERGVDEPADEQQEWDRDGQYFHYLTQWMHALSNLTRASGDPKYNRWAIELARSVHSRFVYLSPLDGRKRMYWKMSIDLSRPLVPAMGQHDPLDGLITYSELMLTAASYPENTNLPDLDKEIREMEEICSGLAWKTDDPLGLGGLLAGSWRTAQMINQGWSGHESLPEIQLRAALAGLPLFLQTRSLQLPASYRLAFRELGLSIGLHAVERLQAAQEENNALSRLATEVLQYRPLTQEIEAYWLDPVSRAAASWQEHRQINTIMLATSLLPDGYLDILPDAMAQAN